MAAARRSRARGRGQGDAVSAAREARRNQRPGRGTLMGRYILARLLQAIPVLLLASIAVWLMIYLLPGDPAVALLGCDVTPEQLDRARERMGLNQPLPVQYVIWLGRTV